MYYKNQNIIKTQIKQSDLETLEDIQSKIQNERDNEKHLKISKIQEQKNLIQANEALRLEILKVNFWLYLY